MAKVTGGGETTIIDADTNDAAAQALADVISAGLANGSSTRTTGNNPPTGYGVLTITDPNATVINQPAVSVDLIAGGGRGGAITITGSGLPNQQVLGDNENITYFTNGGGGTVALGDGNNVVGTPTIGGGNLSVSTGSGSDTVNIYRGNATVSGADSINTGLPGTFSNAF